MGRKRRKQRKRKLSERSPAERALLAAVLTAALAVIAVAQRDLQRRDASEVKGSKLVWRLVCLNALGAFAYLRWGRRPAPAAPPAAPVSTVP